MKLRIFGRIGKVVAIAAVIAYPAAGFAQIKGSAHDFSTAGWAMGEICLPCHAPHNTGGDEPLWNHASTTATFTVYDSATLDAVPGDPKGGISKLCLSCHDGTVALDSYGGATGTLFITGDANVGTDLSNDHPISITYDAALAALDGELFAPETTDSGLGSTITSDLLFSDQIECATCHDVHNGSGGQPYLLRKSNASSGFCLTCHDK